jgi:hypothetical protein
MKPTPQISSNHDHLRKDGRTAHRHLPLTDYSFQTIAETLRSPAAVGNKGVAELRSFRKVSRDFFGSEMTRDCVAEGLFFAWISCVAAWPIGIAIHQLTRWMI